MTDTPLDLDAIQADVDTYQSREWLSKYDDEMVYRMAGKVPALVAEVRRLREAIGAYLAVDDTLAPTDCSDGGSCITPEENARQTRAVDALAAALGGQ